MIVIQDDIHSPKNEILTPANKVEITQVTNTEDGTSIIRADSRSFEVGFLIGLLAIMVISFFFYFALPSLASSILKIEKDTPKIVESML